MNFIYLVDCLSTTDCSPQSPLPARARPNGPSVILPEPHLSNLLHIFVADVRLRYIRSIGKTAIFGQNRMNYDIKVLDVGLALLEIGA